MKFLTLFFGLLISLISFGQTTIKGVVYDRKGPISGATVTELGTDKELLTNEKGEFELTLTTNDRTIFVGAYGHRFRTIKIRDEKFLKIKLRRQKPRDIAKEGLQRSNGSQQCA
ncbi:MAG: carboxypeptidase-like regulatory domain-containing protein [Bacteroidetes bacterium]|nr:carboxypeptidase-like regulatory domain-containing protein [Bacteroidota bacterium]